MWKGVLSNDLKIQELHMPKWIYSMGKKNYKAVLRSFQLSYCCNSTVIVFLILIYIL